MGQSKEVLYVEDDPMDADFAKEAFEELCGAKVKVQIMTDGEAAARFLGVGMEGEAADAGAKPNIILLDLNIPRVRGKDLLRLIKQSPRLKSIPVIILSTSQFQRDVDESYDLGAAGYFSKPAGYEAYRRIFRTICDYWLTSAILPSDHRN